MHGMLEWLECGVERMQMTSIYVWYIWRWWLFNVSIRCWCCVWKESCWKFAIKFNFMHSIIKIMEKRKINIKRIHHNVPPANRAIGLSIRVCGLLAGVQWLGRIAMMSFDWKLFHEANCNTHTSLQLSLTTPFYSSKWHRSEIPSDTSSTTPNTPISKRGNK